MKKKHITNITYPIRLGQLLKLLNIAQDGTEAKSLIQEGKIHINGEVEKQRGKQLHRNDTIQKEDGTIYVLL